MARTPTFEDDFDGPDLDRSVWLPHYLPMWTSLAASAATYEIADSCLRLSIPPEQGLWLPEEAGVPLRVAALQTGNRSGPVGSGDGQHRRPDTLVVREQQDEFWGWTPEYGVVEMRARAEISPRSMVALWLIGLETEPHRTAEICVFEIFGDSVRGEGPGASAEVGMGLHAFRDPDVAEDFAAPRLPIDVAELHDYAVDWTPERADFLVDGRVVRSCARPPAYPVQLMVTVYDFPDRSVGDDDHLEPALVIDRVRGWSR